MKPSVKHIEGRHLTASDKRNILACIEYLRTEENHAQWLGRPRSKKQYCVAADPETPNRFSVLIRETYTSDHGQRRQSQSRHVVETRGVDPLPAADWSIAQLELFQGGEA
ncbi:hypothetical protein [Ruegeria sp. YS9]|uniref:hypothetical protein n=1 Tax=Ruegeria sp. YS9 TaxID=2966453 RepID=UPI00214B59B6|nr:hypothetical protein [Ruegeria sp. YS9]UUV08714.1 hypothetical protein NOR97_20785 [Ruegeria sp. YS9]